MESKNETVVDKGDTVPLLGKIGRNVKHEKSFRK